MKKRLYSNKYISTSNVLSLDWINFVEKRRNANFKEYNNNCCTNCQSINKCHCKGNSVCEGSCNDLSPCMQGITDPIRFKELLGYSNSNIYGYFTSSMQYPEIVKGGKLIIFDYDFEYGNKSIFYDGSDIYINEQGCYKITYGVVSSAAINGKMHLLLNNTALSQGAELCKSGITKFTKSLNLRYGDVLSLMVRGEFIKLYYGGINGFILIEKCS